MSKESPQDPIVRSAGKRLRFRRSGAILGAAGVLAFILVGSPAGGDEAGPSPGLDVILPNPSSGDFLDLEDNPLFFDPFEPRAIPVLEGDSGDDRPFSLDTIDSVPAVPDPRDPGGAGVQLDNPLVRMALDVAPRVLAIRVWDELGGELANGCGFFVSEDGLVLTDASLLDPSVSRVADYITAVDGFGSAYRISGVRWRDLFSGVALLQADLDGRDVRGLELAADNAAGARIEGGGGEAVRVIALSGDRGLVLADAVARSDETVSGAGWLTITGNDSPGAVGSPVLAHDGGVIGMVSMRIPGEGWVNFATEVAALDAALASQSRAPFPVSRLRELEARDPLDDRRFLEAFEDLYAGRERRAARTLLRLTKAYPRSAECWTLLGLAASELGAEREAVGCQQRAAALDPEVGHHWMSLAVAKLRGRVNAGDPSVVHALEEAVERRPRDFAAWCLLGQELLASGDASRAEDAFRRCLIIRPGLSHAHYLLACALARRGDVPAAELAARRAVEIDRGNESAWFLLGLVLSKEGRSDEAVKAFERTVRLNRAHPKAWLNLAYAYRATSRENEAVLAYRRHLDVSG